MMEYCDVCGKEVETQVITRQETYNVCGEEIMVNAQVMAARFSEVMWLIEQIMWKSLDRRLAHFLLEESALEGTDGLKITHETIGRHMGTAREVVTRMLRYFQGEGMVRLFRGGIELIDRARLEQIAQG